MTGDIARKRLALANQPLDRKTICPDPMAQFRRWFDEAVEAEVFQANAMALATTAGGRPSARMVLMDRFNEDSFVFFTSYASRKGQEMAENPWVSAVFWWGPLFRQVRIEGKVSRLDEDSCDQYFSTRPREHQVESWAFQQSQIIQDRASFSQRIQDLQARFRGKEVPRPADFGGYRLEAERMEFWQGRLDWLHDSLRYTRQDDGSWLIERLAP